MIVYSNTKEGFVNDVKNGYIANKIGDAFALKDIAYSPNEFHSWANSLLYMCNVIDDKDIPEESRISIEYQIPLTSKRVDFLIAGSDENNKENIVVVELKQWETSEKTSRSDLVTAFVGGAKRTLTHPSYQAYSYAKIIESFNEVVWKENISLIACAYLHNYKEENRDNLDCDLYKEAISVAPIFLCQDGPKLRTFIKKYIKKKGEEDILLKIENGKLKPAKALQDALASMLKGNEEFTLIDEQKVVYETVKTLVLNTYKKATKFEEKPSKYTIIVKGGPGTGKSVVAIKLLSDLIKEGKSTVYVTKNSAPRNVYFAELKKNNFKNSYIKGLFLGSGSFVDEPNNRFDCIVCDEAHRLNAKSGIFKNRGNNQIQEIIHASRISVFFIDEDQIVTTSDIGSVDEIKYRANLEGSKVICGEDLALVSQFRCNGSDGYLAFLDNLLEIRQTANYTIDNDYDVKIFDDPNKMRDELREKNKLNNKARMIAGYCYEWITKNDLSEDAFDIVLKNGFKAKWNFDNTQTWAIDPNSFEQVGCIHTSQGLEFDYIGCIIGRDLRYENGHTITDYKQRAKTDQSLKGIKQSKNWDLADRIIRDTYKVILSRAQKGCYIYCEDRALAEHMAKMLKKEIIE